MGKDEIKREIYLGTKKIRKRDIQKLIRFSKAVPERNFIGLNALLK